MHNASLDTARARKSLSTLRKELRAWEKTVEADQITRGEKKKKERDGEELDEKEYLVRSLLLYLLPHLRIVSDEQYGSTRPLDRCFNFLDLGTVHFIAGADCVLLGGEQDPNSAARGSSTRKCQSQIHNTTGCR